MQGQHRTRCWRMRICVCCSRWMLMASALWSPSQSFANSSIQSWALWVIILRGKTTSFSCFVSVYIRIPHHVSFAYLSQTALIVHPTSRTRPHLETLYECATQGGNQTLQRRRWQKEERGSDKESARLRVVMLRGRNASENLYFMWVQTE